MATSTSPDDSRTGPETPPGHRWLTDREQLAWRAYLRARHLLDEAFDRQLQRDAGMPHAYYMILTTLEEEPGHQIRMSELADRLLYSPSRLTHAIAAMERSGWVQRQPCPTDRRGQLAVLTPLGQQVQHETAIGHVPEVITRMFDHFDDAQVDQLHNLCSTIIAGFENDESSQSPQAAP